jgi:prevent-host-death family protein
MQSTLTELRRNTGRVLAAVRAGNEVLVTEDGRPLFRMVPCEPESRYDELCRRGVIRPPSRGGPGLAAIRAFVESGGATPLPPAE